MKAGCPDARPAVLSEQLDVVLWNHGTQCHGESTTNELTAECLIIGWRTLMPSSSKR